MDIIIAAICLIALVLISGFFSGSETAMMSLNRYRIRHLAKGNHVTAKRIQKFLKRPDKLLGVILIGNTFANILASALATLIAGTLFGALGIAIATICLTFIVLIFSEIIPKRIAAVKPEPLAFKASLPLQIILWLLYPVVWAVNLIVNIFLKLLRIPHAAGMTVEPMNLEELYSVVDHSSPKLTNKHKNMLMGVLELEKISISDVMTPRHLIECIDISDDLLDITQKIYSANHSSIIVYNEDFDTILGTLAIKNAYKHFYENKAVTKQSLQLLIETPYFTPDSISLQTQLINFQNSTNRLAIVVDEYGSVEGVLTVEDILEEIVGEFSDTYNTSQNMKKVSAGNYMALGQVTIREINRHLHLNLPTNGPKTISGLIIETLQAIPDGPCCFQHEGYIIEVVKIHNNTISQAKIITLSDPDEDKITAELSI
ncbi:CNNM domain-containing protein [Francisellaceae bacterium]|nr:CNNM domain-containing protein [Francisellaceae bacterium]